MTSPPYPDDFDNYEDDCRPSSSDALALAIKAVMGISYPMDVCESWADALRKRGVILASELKS